MSRKKRAEIEDLAREISDAMYRAAEYLEKHPLSRFITAKNIAKAVKKYLSSSFSPDDDATLYNALMDALVEPRADKKEAYPQKEPGIDY